jgi:cytochrome c553
MPHENRSPRAFWRPLLLLALAAPATSLSTELTQQSSTASADVPHGRVLYLKHCAGCHGHRAWGDGVRTIPSLAGQREAYILAQLTRFTSGDRPGSEVHGPAMHDALQPPDVSRAQALRDLGAWLSRTEPNSEPEQGSGRASVQGGRAYAKDCAGCHGMDGAGTEQGTPALASQHYSYLLAQLRSFSSGRIRHTADAAAVDLGSSDQQQAIADYLSRVALRGHSAAN